MSGQKSRIRLVLLSLVWVAVVAIGVVIAVTRYEKYGIASFVIAGMAGAMLVVFLIANLPRRAREEPRAGSAGKIATGGLILGAIAILIFSVIKGFKNFGIAGSAVLILFAVVFIGIFRDFLRDSRKKKRRARKSPPQDKKTQADREGVEGADPGAGPDGDRAQPSKRRP